VTGVSTQKVDQLVDSLGLRISRSEVSRIAQDLDEQVEGVSPAAVGGPLPVSVARRQGRRRNGPISTDRAPDADVRARHRRWPSSRTAFRREPVRSRGSDGTRSALGTRHAQGSRTLASRRGRHHARKIRERHIANLPNGWVAARTVWRGLSRAAFAMALIRSSNRRAAPPRDRGSSRRRTSALLPGHRQWSKGAARGRLHAAGPSMTCLPTESPSPAGSFCGAQAVRRMGGNPGTRMRLPQSIPRRRRGRPHEDMNVGGTAA
jgi:Transposase, Mutator family